MIPPGRHSGRRATTNINHSGDVCLSSEGEQTGKGCCSLLLRLISGPNLSVTLAAAQTNKATLSAWHTSTSTMTKSSSSERTSARDRERGGAKRGTARNRQATRQQRLETNSNNCTIGLIIGSSHLPLANTCWASSERPLDQRLVCGGGGEQRPEQRLVDTPERKTTREACCCCCLLVATCTTSVAAP